MKNSYTLWFTGRPGSGKTTLSRSLYKGMKESTHLDGDILRDNLCSDLGFSEEDRQENLRRAAHVARLLNEAEKDVVASFITPTEENREMVKQIIGPNRFRLVYIDCPLEECEKRDPKGMYAKARRGEIKDFTGISSPFDPVKGADLVVNTYDNSFQECLDKIADFYLSLK